MPDDHHDHRYRRPRRCRLAGSDPRLIELLFLGLLRRGYYISPRGYMALSLALTEDQLAGFVTAVPDVLREQAQMGEHLPRPEDQDPQRAPG